jgi:transcriptional regulator with XRE-family HTH domain
MLDSEIVGKVIQKIRETKGLSQEVVSGLADIGRTHLSAIERGQRKPTLETLFRLADALNIPASTIIMEIEKEIRRTENATQ